MDSERFISIVNGTVCTKNNKFQTIMEGFLGSYRRYSEMLISQVYRSQGDVEI